MRRFAIIAAALALAQSCQAFDLVAVRYQQPASTRAWSPLSITNPCMLWLDAQDASTSTLNTSNRYVRLADKSGHAFDAVQTTALKCPSNTAVGGFPMLKFVAGQSMVLSGGLATSNQTALTTFAVARIGATNQQGVIICYSRGDNAASPRYGLAYGLIGSVGWQSGFRRLDSEASGQAAISGMDTTNGPRLIRGEVNYQAGKAYIYTNSVLAGSNITFQTAGTTPTNASLSVCLGGINDTLFIFAGEIGEIIQYQGIPTTADSTNLEAYLKTKWGL